MRAWEISVRLPSRPAPHPHIVESAGLAGASYAHDRYLPQARALVRPALWRRGLHLGRIGSPPKDYYGKNSGVCNGYCYTCTLARHLGQPHVLIHGLLSQLYGKNQGTCHERERGEEASAKVRGEAKGRERE